MATPGKQQQQQQSVSANVLLIPLRNGIQHAGLVAYFLHVTWTPRYGEACSSSKDGQHQQQSKVAPLSTSTKVSHRWR
jgi:hypothetical protein